MNSPAGPEPISTREYVRAFPIPEAIDLERLRRIFGELMDEAARDVQCAGYEQDDSIVERLLELRCSREPQTLTIPVESLTDRARLLAPFRAEHERRFGATPIDDIEVVAVRARCTVFGGPGQGRR